MKMLYNVQVQKADLSFMGPVQVLAEDTGTSPIVPAAINAQNYVFGLAGAGASLVMCNRVGQVDHDLT